MIPKNHSSPFWRQNLTVPRHLPVYDVNVTSQTKKSNNWRTKLRRELVNPSFCSLWVGDSFMNNLFQNYSPSVWKYTENEQYDVMWRHMTSRGPIFKKSWEMIFWTIMITDTKFGVNWKNRKEMVNESKMVLKTALWRHSDVMMTSPRLFWLFPKTLNRFDVLIEFLAKNTHFCGFYGGGHNGPPPHTWDYKKSPHQVGLKRVKDCFK